ncbi:hypothetical protein RDWZM_000895 [Blomia tropicalis]|uniref:G-protein coupled receptors family 1 profile domain-containing protein n=1 Tax=Blomia tropicalis TaxID=40697 RepID=A0A9Q0MEW4_BLOTA|nr:hypothetical protein RDWZM_000895 [Blomia tropicalis]
MSYAYEMNGTATMATTSISTSHYGPLSLTNSGTMFHHRSIDRLVEVSYLYRTIMAIIYFVTAIFAFVVNLFALLILFFGRRKSRQLNKFLSNLGFSDIIFAIFNIPFTYITLVYNTWWLPEFLCPLTSFVQVLAPTVAFYTLIAIGIGRYFVIVTGHESMLLTKSSHTRVVIISIWVLAVIVAAPTLFATKILPVTYGNETGLVECTEDWTFLDGKQNRSWGTWYTIVVFVLTFILPVIALTYLYGHIGMNVYRHQLPAGNDNRVTNRNLTQTKVKRSDLLEILSCHVVDDGNRSRRSINQFPSSANLNPGNSLNRPCSFNHSVLNTPRRNDSLVTLRDAVVPDKQTVDV